MSERQKSQRGFVAVTLITLLAIALVLIVYASILGTIPGGEVTVGGVGGSISYSLNNDTLATWTGSLNVTGTGISWYARLTTTAGGYAGPVTISWQLQKKQANGTYTNYGSASSTSYTLNATVQTIYASTNGLIVTNRDWSQTANVTASYKVVATISSTG